MGGSRSRPAIMTVILALRRPPAVVRTHRTCRRRSLCGCSGGSRVSRSFDDSEFVTRPGVARYVFGDEVKPGKR